jgi:outer membrane protein TolC
MTNMTLAEAKAACASERQRAMDAAAAMKSAFEAVEAARASLESAKSVLDGSTFATGAGILTIVGACLLPEPFSKAVCIGGIAAGGLTAAGSEVDRQSDISSAEAALAAAQATYDQAVLAHEVAFNNALSCGLHHLSKKQP